MTLQTSGEKAADKIRVALIITELSAGGAEKALFQLATRLDRTRFEPVVFSLSARPCDQENSLAPALRDAGIETVELGMKSALDFPRAFFRLKRELAARECTVAQSFMFHANFLGRLAAKSAGVPLVCSGIRVAERDSGWRRFLDSSTRRFCDAWICVGESVAEYERETVGIPGGRIFSIPNGVSDSAGSLTVPEGASPNPDAISSFVRGRKIMLAAGRLARQKGFDELLGDAAEWATPELRREWALVILGEGEERGALEQIISEKGLSDFAMLAGWRSDASRLIGTCDLFLLPSRWEGMPNALLEAAASGRACLCRDVEGVGEILGDLAEAQRCGEASGADWRAMLQELTTDAELREQLGEANREHVLEAFSPDETARKYERLWLRLLDEKPGAPEKSGEAA